MFTSQISNRLKHNVYYIVSVSMNLTSMKLHISHLYDMDLLVARVVHSYCGNSPHACILWEVVSLLGDGMLWFLVILPCLLLNQWVLGYCTIDPTTMKVICVFYLCNVVDIVVICFLNLIFKRNRPPHHNHKDQRFIGVDSFSFPSGHATRCWCVAGMFTWIQRGVLLLLLFSVLVCVLLIQIIY